MHPTLQSFKIESPDQGTIVGSSLNWLSYTGAAPSSIKGSFYAAFCFREAFFVCFALGRTVKQILCFRVRKQHSGLSLVCLIGQPLWGWSSPLILK